MIYKGQNKENIEKYGKNMPFKAWPIDNVNKQKTKDIKFTCKGYPKILFNGRYCAVSGFIFAIVDDKYSILTNLRGSGTPDYQNCWNAPCGYLEKYENSKEGIAREILEECGFQIDTNDLKVIHVETEPEECNNGNVTIRHIAFLGKIIPHYVERNGGEENEVTKVKWIPVSEIKYYKWAFNHAKTIKKYRPKKWKIRMIEFYYKWFKGYNKKYTDITDLMIKDYN